MEELQAGIGSKSSFIALRRLKEPSITFDHSITIPWKSAKHIDASSSTHLPITGNTTVPTTLSSGSRAWHATRNVFSNDRSAPTHNTPTKMVEPALQAPPVLKSCPKCKHLAKNTNGVTIHATLAYSRCRCHRIFHRKLQQYQLMQRAKPAPKRDMNTPFTSRETDLTYATQKPAIMDHSSRTLQTRDSPNKSNQVPRQTRPHAGLPPIRGPHIQHQDHLGKQNPRLSTHHLSNESVSTCRLPTLGCPSLVGKDIHQDSTHHLQREMSTTTTCTEQSITLQTNHRCITELSDLIRYIPTAKSSKLKLVFKNLDKNDDGCEDANSGLLETRSNYRHLSLVEFLDGIPIKRINGNNRDYFQQLYHMLSDITYFGQREFIVCYCIAEIQAASRIAVDSSIDVDREVFQKVIIPYMCLLSNHLVDERVSTTTIQDVVSQLNRDHGIPFHISLRTSRLTKTLQDSGTLHLLDCVALALYYMHVIRCS